MARIILCVIIIVACGFMGIAKSMTYHCRVSDLQDLKSVFKILEREISYKKDPLPEVFLRVGKYDYRKASQMLLACAEKLKAAESLGFYTPWQQAVTETYSASDLKDEDMAIVCELGQQLGKSHIKGQESMFALANARLEHQLFEALEDKNTKGKMYKSLGFSMGVVIAVIFF